MIEVLLYKGMIEVLLYKGIIEVLLYKGMIEVCPVKTVLRPTGYLRPRRRGIWEDIWTTISQRNN